MEARTEVLQRRLPEGKQRTALRIRVYDLESFDNDLFAGAGGRAQKEKE
jgi:hypothetical protein